MSGGKWEKAPHSLWDDAPDYVTIADKWVYMTLKRLTGPKGTFPGVELIAETAGRGETATRQSLARLKRAGFIDWTDSKGRTSHHYSIFDAPRNPSESDGLEAAQPLGKRSRNPSESDSATPRNPTPSKTVSKTESKTPPPSPPSSVAAVPVATDQREKIDKTFTRFWTTAVKPTGYGKARDAFAAVYAAAPEMIPTVLAAWEQANEAWATWIDRDPNQAQYIPLPATWLQGQGWNDTVLRREREVSKIERLNQIGAALEGMDPDEALNQLLGLPDPVAVGELLPGSPTGDTAPAPTDRRIDDPVDAQLVADTTKGTTVATSQQIKTDWLDRARPLGHPDLDEYDRLADQLTADDAVDATAVRVAVKDCTGPTSRHARDRMLTALRDLAAQAVAS